MGIPMAKRLLGVEYCVTGYNRTKSKAQELLELGMGWSESPRGVAEASDVVFTMMADTEALMAVTQGPYGILEGLGPGDLYIDMGTVAPEVTRNLAARAAERGAQMLDTPVSGNEINVVEGRLSMMVGGPASALEEVRPILDPWNQHHARGDKWTGIRYEDSQQPVLARPDTSLE